MKQLVIQGKDNLINSIEKQAKNNRWLRVIAVCDVTEEVEKVSEKEENISHESDDQLVLLHNKYEDLYGKKVSNVYKNNEEWIKNKIAEKE